MRTQPLNKKLNWQLEISYQLLTAKQRIGSRNDSLLMFDALTDRAFYTVGRTAYSSNTSNLSSSYQVNKVHRLQVASGINYIFNPKAHLPISFFAGASLAYNFSNNVLLHDYRTYSYVRSDKLSKKFMLGGQAGLDVFINHTINVGVFFQHDFTNVGKKQVKSVFRWNQVQLRIGLPLSKH
jgi:hypothetical protein